MVVFVPVFRGLGLVSIYEYLEIRFDRPTRFSLSGVFLVSRALATGVALYAAALVVEVCTGLPLAWSVLLMGGITVVYDMLGGMRAVVWTDVLQMFVLLSGIVLCGVYGWSAAGGWQGVLDHVSPKRLSAIQWAHGVAPRPANGNSPGLDASPAPSQRPNRLGCANRHHSPLRLVQRLERHDGGPSDHTPGAPGRPSKGSRRGELPVMHP